MGSQDNQEDQEWPHKWKAAARAEDVLLVLLGPWDLLDPMDHLDRLDQVETQEWMDKVDLVSKTLKTFMGSLKSSTTISSYF